MKEMNWPTHISDILPNNISQKMGFLVTRFNTIGMLSVVSPVPVLFTAALVDGVDEVVSITADAPAVGLFAMITVLYSKVKATSIVAWMALAWVSK